ncbi:MAG TPA: DMT family transporter [Gaiellaceae bacterium]|nr:DMT family transporter [Gaiellaceae bacterium]
MQRIVQLRGGEAPALVAALGTVVLWSSAFVGIRSAGRSLSPEALALGRLLVSSVALGVFAAVRRERLPARRDLARIAFYGVLWLVVYNIVLNEAERRVDAGTAAMLVNIGPILIALLAGLLLREGFPRGLLAGCVVAFAGTAIIALATSDGGSAASWGAVLCVVAAFAYAAAVIVQKPVLLRASAFQVTWIACTVATIVCLPLAPQLLHDLRGADGSSIAWTVYLGIFPTAVGFVLWAYALGRTTAGRMGSMTYLVPPIAIALGWAFLGETPALLAVAGGALCLGGVVLARR